jgi:GTP pyrophosphokinase
MLLVMAKDLRVVMIRLADRLHNMLTLEYVKKEKQKRIAKETLEIYVPIASRLGIYSLRSRLEDLCFKFLRPDDYQNIQEQLKRLGKKQKNLINKIEKRLSDFIKEKGFNAKVYGRYKNSYSIYKKLKKLGKTSIDEIFDIFALRILLKTEFDKEKNEKVESLYQLLGLIHNKWKPVPNRFKDYVGFPKPNGYQSLHTTIMGLAPHSHKEPVEIQIRTEKMNEEAEYGIAAHWLYKETKGSVGVKKNSQLEWIDRLSQISFDFGKGNDEELVERLKVDFFQDRIFVFTPDGEVKDLPAESTPLDYAYLIHTDLGHKCYMAKVNGSVVPLNHELKNGDIVEVLTRNDITPKVQWISLVKTNNAKTKIKAYFKRLNRDSNIKNGKDLINSYLDRLGKQPLDPKLQLLESINGEKIALKKREELVEQVGNGSMLASALIKKIFSYKELNGILQKKGKFSKKKKLVEPKIKTSNIDKYILISGQKGVPVKLAACCKPTYGNKITGYITRSKFVTIHKSKCHLLLAGNKDRFVDAKWVKDGVDEYYEVLLSIETVPEAMIMKDIAATFEKHNTSITNFYINKKEEDKYIWFVKFEVDNFDKYDAVVGNLDNLNGIFKIEKK